MSNRGLRRTSVVLALLLSILLAPPASAASRTTPYGSPYSYATQSTSCMEDIDAVCVVDARGDRASGALRTLSEVTLPALKGGSGIALGYAGLQQSVGIAGGVSAFTLRVNYDVLEAMASAPPVDADARVRLGVDMYTYDGRVASSKTILAGSTAPAGSRAPFVIRVEAPPGQELKGTVGVWIHLESRAAIADGPSLVERVARASAAIDITSIQITT